MKERSPKEYLVAGLAGIGLGIAAYGHGAYRAESDRAAFVRNYESSQVGQAQATVTAFEANLAQNARMSAFGAPIQEAYVTVYEAETRGESYYEQSGWPLVVEVGGGMGIAILGGCSLAYSLAVRPSNNRSSVEQS